MILYYAAIMLPKEAPESWTEFAEEKGINIEDMMSGDYFFKFSVKYQPKHVNKALVPCSCPLLPPIR